MKNKSLILQDYSWLLIWFVMIPLYLFTALQSHFPFEMIIPTFLKNIVLPIAICYAVGSIPFGLLFAKSFGLGDLRKTGSGNIGATNMLRTGGKVLGLMTLIFDVAKGSFAAWVVLNGDFISPAISIAAPSSLALIIALFAVIGHIFPVWLGFKGGKGVATYLGVVLIISWPLLLIATAAWLLTALFTRYSSLSALVMIFAVPLSAHFFSSYLPGQNHFVIWGLISLLIYYKHQENVVRLCTGKESKIGQQK